MPTRRALLSRSTAAHLASLITMLRDSGRETSRWRVARPRGPCPGGPGSAPVEMLPVLSTTLDVCVAPRRSPRGRATPSAGRSARGRARRARSRRAPRAPRDIVLSRAMLRVAVPCLLPLGLCGKRDDSCGMHASVAVAAWHQGHLAPQGPLPLARLGSDTPALSKGGLTVREPAGTMGLPAPWG